MQIKADGRTVYVKVKVLQENYSFGVFFLFVCFVFVWWLFTYWQSKSVVFALYVDFFFCLNVIFSWVFFLFLLYGAFIFFIFFNETVFCKVIVQTYFPKIGNLCKM